MNNLSKDELKNRIAQNETEEAIEDLFSLFSAYKDTHGEQGIDLFHDQLILLSGQLYGIQQEVTLGVVDSNYAKAEKTRVSRSILSFINSLPTELFQIQKISHPNKKSLREQVIEDIHQEEFEFDIFLSFSSKDRDTVKPIWEALRGYGLKVFLSDESLKINVGQSFISKIEYALKNSKHFILVCSPNSMASEWVVTEYETFYNEFFIKNKEARKLMVLKGKDFQNHLVPLFLRRLQLADSAQQIIESLTQDVDVQKRKQERGGLTKRQDLPEMVFVQGGTFQMGSNDGLNDEKPVHTVTLSDFYISKYSVSNAEYAAFLNAKGNQTEGGVEWIDLDREYENEKCRIQKWGDRFVVEAGYENHPVIYVSWYGAKAYCAWAGGQLPSEAQWEYAARGGQKSKGYRYAGSNDLDEVAVHSYNSGGKIQRRGSKAPNELGLYDMSGNVREWCQDIYDADFYKSELAKNPNPMNNIATSEYRLVRGGSWFYVVTDCRVSDRYYTYPVDRVNAIGFRLSRVSN